MMTTTTTTTTATTTTARVIIAGIEISPDAYDCLASVGMATDEHVRADLARVAAGDADALLSACLDGADADAAAGWREYVSDLIVASDTTATTAATTTPTGEK